MTEEDSEKGFHSIMDKLFTSPKSKSVFRNQSSRPKKRGNSVLSGSNDSGGNIVPMSGLNRSVVPVGSISASSSSSLEATLCRPWDRKDLMRRLATFKSMTWFGKPKVVGAVNCARRGWINVEMDIIACEACGARLLFSTPSSWTQQQIEKAAAVFSLKLDSGHKLLCPWIDNACDESLAQFPPKPAPALIDGYRERSSALSRLSALPIISSSAIDYMSCPQLEHFLHQSSMDFDLGSMDTIRTEYRGHEHSPSANLYYQAQKLISLCGWEPRSLPYAVDCKDWSTQAAQNGHPKESSQQIVNGWNPGVVMYSASGADDVVDIDEDPSSGQQSDPASVVLDCKFCGASVGLWAFSIVPRPLEFFRLVHSSKVNGKNDSANCDANTESPRTDESVKENHVGHNGCLMGTATSSKDRSLILNLSIAGGPSPAKQNYRATVSLPIISRHLRADLSSKSDRYHVISNVSSIDQETTQCVNTDPLQREKDHATPCKLIALSEDMETLEQKRNEDGLGISSGDDQSCLNEDDPLQNEKNDDMSSEGRCLLEQGVPSMHALDTCSDSRMEYPIESSLKLPQGSDGKDTPCEDEFVKDLKQVQSDQGMEFDPIRQHRHFCPWIVSTGKTGPGWKLTLFALGRGKESSHPSLPDSPSTSMFKVDDPITSVRNLFMSPSAKKLKASHDSR